MKSSNIQFEDDQPGNILNELQSEFLPGVDRAYYLKLQEMIQQLIKQYNTPALRALDLNCACGCMTFQLCQFFSEVRFVFNLYSLNLTARYKSNYRFLESDPHLLKWLCIQCYLEIYWDKKKYCMIIFVVYSRKNEEQNRGGWGSVKLLSLESDQVLNTSGIWLYYSTENMFKNLDQVINLPSLYGRELHACMMFVIEGYQFTYT